MLHIVSAVAKLKRGKTLGSTKPARVLHIEISLQAVTTEKVREGLILFFFSHFLSYVTICLHTGHKKTLNTCKLFHTALLNLNVKSKCHGCLVKLNI